MGPMECNLRNFVKIFAIILNFFLTHQYLLEFALFFNDLVRKIDNINLINEFFSQLKDTFEQTSFLVLDFA